MTSTETSVKCKYIQLKTYGRTGSNAISNYFSAVGYNVLNSHDIIKIQEQLTTARPMVIHDHSHDYVMPNIGKQSICLFLKRRDSTSQLLSMIVAKHFNFFHDTDPSIQESDRVKPEIISKFTLDKGNCLSEARIFSEWHYNAQITLANSNLPYMTLYYEDYIDDIDYFSFLHVRDGFKLMEQPEKKNSIQSKDVIENYDQAVEWLKVWNLSNGIYP